VFFERMKLRQMRLPENVARMGEMRNAYKISVGKCKEWRSHLRVCFSVEGIEIGIKWAKQGGRVGTGPTWFRVGTSSGHLSTR
jgi:hypothetical protein